MGSEIRVNPAWCKGCGICVEFCPGEALGLVRGKARMLFPERCVKCGLCEMRCPDYAIWLENGAGDLAQSQRRALLQSKEAMLENVAGDLPQSQRRVLLQGNEAVVEGALAAGMRFFAGYPITPSTEIAERCALRLPQEGGRFIQMEDELASLAAVIGASVVGVKAMTATSGPGFSLMQENIGYAALAEIPCMIVDVQRAGPSTGRPTSPSQGDYMQARWGTHGDHPVIAISPSSVQEAYHETIRAFNLSERLRVPVILLMDETVGHMREGVDLSNPVEVLNRLTRDDPEQAKMPYDIVPGEFAPRMTPFGQGVCYNITGLLHDEWAMAVNLPPGLRNERRFKA